MFKKIYKNLSISSNENLIQNSKKRFLESKTIQNNRDNLFKYEKYLLSLSYISKSINSNLSYHTKRVLSFFKLSNI